MYMSMKAQGVRHWRSKAETNGYWQLRSQQMQDKIFSLSFFWGGGGRTSFTQSLLSWNSEINLPLSQSMYATTPRIWHGLNYWAISPIPIFSLTLIFSKTIIFLTKGHNLCSMFKCIQSFRKIRGGFPPKKRIQIGKYQAIIVILRFWSKLWKSWLLI